MSIKYRFTPITGYPAQNQSRATYRVSPVPVDTIDCHRIAQIIAQKTALSEADVYATIIALSDEIRFQLSHGNLVDLEPLGRFFLSIASLQPVTELPEYNVRIPVRVNGIRFQPHAPLRKAVYGAQLVHDRQADVARILTPAMREEQILALAASVEFLTIARCAAHNRVSRNTTLADLNRLVGAGKLGLVRSGHFSIFRLPVDARR